MPGDSQIGSRDGAIPLRVCGLNKRYRSRARIWRKGSEISAANGVSFEIQAGKTLGLVGSSGSGKSTVARCVTRLERPDAGEIWLGDTDIAPLRSRELRPFRAKIQMIFQDPVTSMNPRMSAAEIIQEPLLIQNRGTREDRRSHAAELMKEIGLSRDWLDRRITEFTEFAIGFAYGALLEGFWNGQTIGKRLFHLRVIDHTGLPLRIEQAWVRNLMRVFDGLPLAYLVGGISVLSSPLMQRFGDRVAGTLVVRQTPLAAPGEETWARQKYNSFAEYPAIAVRLRRGATPEIASLVQDALRRRNELAPYARREIYRELAMYLQSEISPFPDELLERLSDEQYLINASGILFADQRPSRVQG